MAKERTMPRNKDLKRRVRARMQKTGESYTAARSNVVRRQPPPLPDDYETLAGMSDETVSARTGRSWPEWVTVLDGVGAAGMEHRAIARWIYDQTGLDWWAQMVTVGYERIRGLRSKGQRRSGLYEAGKSRTFPAAVSEIFDAFTDAKRRRRWLPVKLTIRKATPHKSVRITLEDGTGVDVYITAKGEAKGTVTIQHTKLASRDAVDAAKTFWAERFDDLAKLLK